MRSFAGAFTMISASALVKQHGRIIYDFPARAKAYSLEDSRKVYKIYLDSKLDPLFQDPHKCSRK